MRIAIVKKFFADGGGGAERYTREVVKGLASIGHEVTIVAERFNSGLKEIDWLPVSSSGFSVRGQAYQFHRGVQKTLGKVAPFDLVYSIARTFPVDIFRITEQIHADWLSIGYPSWQKMNPRHRRLLRLEQLTINPAHVRRIVANSDLMRRRVIDLFDYPAERVSVLVNGVDHNCFFPPFNLDERNGLRSRLGSQPGQYILLFVAADFKLKGLPSAIKALAALPESFRTATRLWIVGGDSEKPYRRLADQLGVGDNLRFFGECRQLRDIYAAADLLVYPSLYDTFGNVCLEACACGLPVLTTARAGAAEIIAPGRNGYVVADHSRIDLISGYIQDHLKLSPDHVLACSQAAAAVAAKYTWDSHVQQLERLFREVVSGA